MDVKGALQIGDLTKGQLVGGHTGINREITSIEVMEVPEVISWVTSGLLVMTTFYSIKDDPERQVEIVQSLIDKKAAGIVIKLGRFIEEIPKNMLKIADENAFPIITIPKDISYINVLTPLYEALYEEKQLEVESVQNPFFEFETMKFKSLSDAIEIIYEIVKSPVYIEDTQGSLLYVSEELLPDGWRKSSTLFSEPEYSDYQEVLEDWHSTFTLQTYQVFKMQGYRNRIVVPLLSNKNAFAFLHILYSEKMERNLISALDMKKLSVKISELFMNEQLFLQKKRIEDIELLEGYLNNGNRGSTKREFLVINIQADWIGKPHFPSFYLIDQSCLIRKRLHGLVGEISGCTAIIFEKYHNFYVLLIYEKDSHSDILKQIKENIEVEAGINPMWVAVGPAIKDISHFDDCIRSVDKTMEIGRKIRPEESLYTYDKLGIYEILINLTSDTLVQTYIQDVLGPLLKSQNKELLVTLEVYLHENGNVSKASEKLFIHRRTLTYRIQRIQELLNMNVDDAESRFILRFCMNIRGLSK